MRTIWTIITAIAVFEFFVSLGLINGGRFLFGAFVAATSLAWLWLTVCKYGRE